jgi:hypothetical protein
MPLPANPDVLLTRADAAAALTEVGYPVAKATLATKATRGGGPPYIVFNGRALYKWADLLAWAEASSTVKVASTSEFDALRQSTPQRIAVAAE